MNYDLNADGDLSRVWGQKGSTVTTYANAFNYNSSGAVEKLKLGNGKWETTKYNERLQITEIGLGNGPTDTSLLKLEFGYGNNTQNNGSMRSQKISFNGLAQPFEQTYTYDDLNRLQIAEEKVNNTTTWKHTFTIDRYGNRRFDANNSTTLGSCSQSQCNPMINTSDNRFSSGQGYGYDQNGNVTQDAQGRRFGYDAENHQKEFFGVGNSSATPDATYSYDGEGRRVKKISSTETTVFVYNASGQLVAEYSTVLAPVQEVSYLTTDHLGSPRVITNENGVVTDRKDFSAFGEETVTSQRISTLGYTDAEEPRKDYTGYEKDTESGLEFAQARYYNPGHGRFTSVDPLTASATIRNPQSFNRYSYTLNSPYKFTDPLGLMAGSCNSHRCHQIPPSGHWLDNAPHEIENRPASEQVREQQPASSPAANHEAVHSVPPDAPPLPTAERNVAQPSPPPGVTGFDLLISGSNQVPDTPHPEVPKVDNLGLVDTTTGGFMVLNVQVTFSGDADVSDYRHVRTAVILGSSETRSGDDENPSKSQTRVDGQNRFVYDNPGMNVVIGVPKARLTGATFAAAFVAGEYNKKTNTLDSNVFFYAIKIVFGKNGSIDRTNSGAGKITRDQFIKATGIKNPEKTLK